MDASYSDEKVLRHEAGHVSKSEPFVQVVGSSWKCQYAQVYFCRHVALKRFHVAHVQACEDERNAGGCCAEEVGR